MNRGISLIEIILALALFSMIMTGFLNLQWNISDLERSNGQYISAKNWARVNISYYLQNHELASSTITLGQFHSMSLRPITKCLSVLTAHSEWKNNNSTSTDDTSVLISEINEANRLDGDCGGVPNRFVSVNFELMREIDLGYPVSDVDIDGDEIIASFRVESENGPSFAFVSLQEETPPTYSMFGKGINALDMAGGTAFASQNSSTSQLISIKNIFHENYSVATSSLPGVGGQRPEGVSVFYYNPNIFVGTKRTAGPEFHVFNDSNGTLAWLGSLELNHNINDIEVHGDYAYLATSGNTKDLIILNISNPNQIVQAAAIDLPGNEDGKTILAMGNLLFLGRYKNTAPGHPELYALNTDSPQFDQIAHTRTDGDINDLAFANGFVYAATSNPTKELQIFNFDMKRHSFGLAGSADLPTPATALDLQDNYCVVAAGTKIYMYVQHE